MIMKTLIFLLLGLFGLYFFLYFNDYVIRIIGLCLLVASIIIKKKSEKEENDKKGKD